MVSLIEKYARYNEYKGIVIRSTESAAMNHRVLKMGVESFLNTTEERVEFGKRNGFRYNVNAPIECDENGNIFGYYILTF